MSNYPPDPLPYQPFNSPAAPPPLRLKGERKFSIIGAMIRAPFFHAGVARDVARNWNGIGFWYLFLLLLITWVIVMAKVHLAVAAFTRNDFPTAIKDVPPITLRNGHVTSPVDQPYYIRESKNGKTIAVLDTTGQINSMDDTDAIILLTDHKIWSRQNSEVKQYDLSKIKYFYIDKARITGWMNKLSRWIAPALLPLAIVGSLCWRLVQVLIYGTIVLGFSSGFRANLDYPAALRLAVISITPVILLDTVLSLGGWSIPMWWLIGFAISLLYMAIAVKANSNPPTMMQTSPMIAR